MKNPLSCLALAIIALSFAANLNANLVDSLVDAYLDVQSGLAADDLSAARSGAEAYIVAFGSASQSLDPDKMLPEARAIAAATEISSARVSFEGLTRQIVNLVNYMGLQNEELALYLASCPMAFDGKGAQWVQSSEAIANPYFGSQMLRCGSVQQRIAGSAFATHPTANSSQLMGIHKHSSDADDSTCEMACCGEKDPSCEMACCAENP